MYRMTCDGYPLLDSRDDEFILISPKVKLEVNTVGEGSFTIHKNHPYYDMLQPLKSIFEVSDEYGVIFRGRMTGDSRDFNNGKAVDLEGAMAFFNDSIVRPYSFPNDFLNDAEYKKAAANGNVVAFYLGWLIDQHNSQVDEFKRFKLGNVTVTDPNNYITRSASAYPNTWEEIKSKLFENEELGGYLCIRYEEDGNYIDYLKEFELTNTQGIVYGENLLDMKHDSDSTATYTAAVPLGAKLSEEQDAERLNIKGIADGNITPDIVKKGDMMYSKSGVERYGWIYAPIKDTTWDSVTVASNLSRKCAEFLEGDAVKHSESVEFKAVDLHFTDAEIRSFRIYRNVTVNSPVHGLDGVYPLPKLEIALLNPQSTNITVGDTKRTLTALNAQKETQAAQGLVNTSGEIAKIHEEIVKIDAITGDYQSFKPTVESQLSVMASEIAMNFSKSMKEIDDVEGDLQGKFTELAKYIRFSVDGIEIGDSKSPLKLFLDNDMIHFKKDNITLGWWDGTDFHTGNLVVDVKERAQFGNYAFIPRSDGSLQLKRVGG